MGIKKCSKVNCSIPKCTPPTLPPFWPDLSSPPTANTAPTLLLTHHPQHLTPQRKSKKITEALHREICYRKTLQGQRSLTGCVNSTVCTYWGGTAGGNQSGRRWAPGVVPIPARQSPSGHWRPSGWALVQELHKWQWSYWILFKMPVKHISDCWQPVM